MSDNDEATEQNGGRDVGRCTRTSCLRGMRSRNRILSTICVFAITSLRSKRAPADFFSRSGQIRGVSTKVPQGGPGRGMEAMAGCENNA